MEVVAVIGDIVDSRGISHRSSVQNHLYELFMELNVDRNDILSPYTLTLGDEFQVVFAEIDRMFPDMIRILSEIHPYRMRFSIARGEILTEINPRQAIGMDGPVFYRARDALDILKRDNGFFRVTTGTMADRLINSSLRLVSHVMKSWNRNRLQIFFARLTGSQPRTIAQSMDISESAVYKNIQSGGLELVSSIFTETVRLLVE